MSAAQNASWADQLSPAPAAAYHSPRCPADDNCSRRKQPFFQIRCLQHFDNPLTGRRITRQFLPGQRSSIYTSSLQRFDKATPKSRFRSCITGIPQHIYRKRKQHFFHSSRFTITERGSRNCQRHCQNLSQTFFQSRLQIYFLGKASDFFCIASTPLKITIIRQHNYLL